MERRLMRPYDPVTVRNRAILAAMIALCLATIVAINVVCIARAPSTYQQGN
jgi:hypothetical protein